ncbi:MauE/DoxX family redox-associated membrane protein [Nocardia sp. NBC_00565]|uniref:MauE/DoxX family redox-associated membrane protein n=1 Tax=Nocardia sp. NBC_00565 TaxID=2975993 RepID=UPI002E80AE01|nr:MauE/DoxX family redox-associated membrane protein [Nocardia sp. NBC_00565]
MVLMVVVQVVVAVRLLAAGAGMVREPTATRIAVARYRIVPVSLLVPTAVVLPVAELAIGALLLTGVTVQPAAFAAVVLHAAFAMAISVNLLRGRSFDCGCRGGGRVIDWTLVLQNLVAAAAAASLVAFPPTRLSGTDMVAVIMLATIAAFSARLLVTARQVAVLAGRVDRLMTRSSI